VTEACTHLDQVRVLEPAGSVEVHHPAGLEADASDRAAILGADPERRVPLALEDDVQGDSPGGAADGHVGERLEVGVARTLGETALN